MIIPTGVQNSSSPMSNTDIIDRFTSISDRDCTKSDIICFIQRAKELWKTDYSDIEGISISLVTDVKSMLG